MSLTLMSLNIKQFENNIIVWLSGEKLRYFILKKYQFITAFIDIGTQLTIKDHLLAELE